MEKVCEFCTALRPLVYCKADAAYLCLCCDAKVHLANALSGRHLRALVCNSCRYHLAYVQCLGHKMLVCGECDQKLHDVSLSHQKRAVRSFVGCPSAKDFATLWGFELTELGNGAKEDQFASISCVSADSRGIQISGLPSSQTGVPSMVSAAKLDGGSTGQQGQISCCDQERRTILQQIIDLKRLQLNEDSDHSTKRNGLQETDVSSSVYLYRTHKKLDEKFNQQSQNCQDLSTNLLEKDSPPMDMNPETLSATFPQLDNFSSSSVVDLLHGDSFWTCKSPLGSNQLWSQNIQDLGICEELVCQDDFNIPDVDLTFQNFEEIFGGDQDPARVLLGDKDVSCSSLEKDMSVDKSDINHSAMEDSSVAASIAISHSTHENQDMNPLNQYCPKRTDPPREILPLGPIMSFSVLRFSAESSHTDHDHNDSALSPFSKGKDDLTEMEITRVENIGNVSVKYKEKKSQLHEKQVRPPSRKLGAAARKRLKGIAKAESY